jgi:hypothetical protein
VQRNPLSLWRGPALAGVAIVGLADAAIAHLEEQRLAALELRMQAELESASFQREPSLGKRTLQTVPAATRSASARRRSGRRALRLATVRTVGVGVAVSLIACGDRAPRNAGESAAAKASESAYRHQVATICSAVAAGERAAERDTDALRHGVYATTSTARQRDALLVATMAAITRSEDNKADFLALVPPAASAALHKTAAGAWSRNLDRVIPYSSALHTARKQRDLAPAIARLRDERPAIQRDFANITASLERLGGEQCRIELAGLEAILLDG